MKYLSNILIILIIMLLGSNLISSDLEIEIEQKGVVKKIKIAKAVLYEKSFVSFDTVVFINEGLNNIYQFYPEIIEGNKRVLRLLLENGEEQYDLMLEFTGNDNEGKIYLKNSKIILSTLNHLTSKKEDVKIQEDSFLSFIKKDKIKLELSLDSKIQKNDTKINIVQDIFLKQGDLNKDEFVFKNSKGGQSQKSKFKNHLEILGILASIFVIIILTN